jgi:uncharacterized repeat protein (TIGR03806 family)
MRAWLILGLAAALGCDDAVEAPFAYDSRPANPTCVAPARPVQTGEVLVRRAFPNLRFNGPTTLTQAPGDASTWYVTEQSGRVQRFANDEALMQAAVTTYADIRPRTKSGGEAGLLGLAFHPNFASNKQVFLSYTTPGPWPGPGNALLRSIVSRFIEKNGTLDVADEQKIFPPDDSGDANTPGLTDQPYSNHNGGGIAFGPDGYLYFGLGDGGSGGDPEMNGQDVNQLMGKILRVDVDNTGGARYGIPASNPFKNGGGRPEIFAIGMRNPWRFTFDRGSGDLWVGDVGQNAWEEIDLVRVGGNYGWRTREGKHCYSPMNNCSTAGLIDPVVEYSHGGSGASVVGGYVYRGKAMPGLVGVYFYGDTITGELFAIGHDAQGQPQHTVLLDTGTQIYSFAEDTDGELYFTSGSGTLHKIVPMGSPMLDTFPKKLSQTGCVDPADPSKPSAGAIPYGVSAELWSDGAEKRRWLAIPDNTKITVGSDGDFDLPNGSVVVKEFALGGKRIETRLFMRHSDGGWAGYSYEWNDAGTDADLLPAGKSKRIGDQTWSYPSRTDCLGCHTQIAGNTLGLEAAQLNYKFRYDDVKRISNQLATLDKIGMFTTSIGDPMARPSLPRIDGPEPLEQRARAYLHSNCSFCHREMGTGQGPQDLRFTQSFAATMLCNVDPQEGNLGVTGTKLIKPADATHSIVSLRMRALDANRMPPLASSRVDDRGTRLIDDWIASISTCP